jgi:hypothetical protein
MMSSHELLSSPNVIGTIMTKRIRRAGYVAGLRETRNSYNAFVGENRRKERASKM